MVTANGRVLGRPSFVAGVIARTSTESCSAELDAAVGLCVIAGFPAGIPDTAFGEADRVSAFWVPAFGNSLSQFEMSADPRTPTRPMTATLIAIERLPSDPIARTPERIARC